MSTHLSEEEIEGYRRRSLAPAQRLVVADHLAACEACRRQILGAEAQEGRLASAFRALQAELRPPPGASTTHLPEEQMLAYVDNELDEANKVAVAGHLEECAGCAAEVEELREFKALMSTYPAKEHGPAPQPTWSERLRAFFGRPALWLGVPAAGMAAAAVAILLAANIRASRAQVARSREMAQVAQNRLQQQLARDQELQSRVARLQQLAAAQEQRSRQAAARLQQQVEALQRENAQIRQSTKRQPPSPHPITPSPAPLRPETTLALNDGAGQFIRDAHGNLLQAQPPLPAVRAALQEQHVKRPTMLARLELPQEKVRGGGEENPKLQVAEPAGKVIITDRPVFSWRPFEGATSYRVRVYDVSAGEENERLVAQTPPQGVSETHWRPDNPLARGRVYQWEATALKGGQEISGVAKFQVLAQAQVDELDWEQQAYAGSPLTLGVLYAQKGLLDEAEKEFRKVLQANPHSAVARKLLDSVRALQRPKE